MRRYLEYLHMTAIVALIVVLFLVMLAVPAAAIYLSVEWHWWAIFGVLLDIVIFPFILILVERL